MPHSIGNMDSFRWCMEAIQVILSKGKSKYSSSSVPISEHVGWGRVAPRNSSNNGTLGNESEILNSGGRGASAGAGGIINCRSMKP